MFSFHKPKVYRSASGCCICGAKSSSSRFTSSKRYEAEFGGCFRTSGRTGDICNACVLLVKRWRKLPQGTERNWQHMLDARSGARALHKGNKQLALGVAKEKRLLSHAAQRQRAWTVQNGKVGDYDSSDDSDLSDCEGFNRRHRHRQSSQAPRHLSSFLDPSYWKRTKVCCGIIFLGVNGEAVLDTSLWHPCVSCRPSCIADVEDTTAAHDMLADDASVISDPNSCSSLQEANDCLGTAAAFNMPDEIGRRRKSAVYASEL